PAMVRVSPRKRPENRSNHLICSVNVAPFAGVMVVLLWMFMVHPECLCHDRGAVDLAKVIHPVFMRGADKEDAIIIAINRENRVFFQSEIIRVNDLVPRIRESLNRGAERKIYIKADARAKYAWVKQVLDSIQPSGVEKIGFLVDQRERKSTSMN